MIKRTYTGKDLRHLRIVNCVSQKIAADLFLTSRGTYSCWESRYKNKKLPKRVTSDAGFFMLLTKSSFIQRDKKTFTQKKKNKKGFLRWLKAILKNLFR